MYKLGKFAKNFSSAKPKANPFDNLVKTLGAGNRYYSLPDLKDSRISIFF